MVTDETRSCGVVLRREKVSIRSVVRHSYTCQREKHMTDVTIDKGLILSRLYLLHQFGMIRSEGVGSQDKEGYLKLILRHERREAVLVGTLVERAVVVTLLSMVGQIDPDRIMRRKELPQLVQTMVMEKRCIGVLRPDLTAIRTTIRGCQAIRLEIGIVRRKTIRITDVLTDIMDDEQARF